MFVALPKRPPSNVRAFGGVHRDGEVVAISILVLAPGADATDDNLLKLFLRTARFEPIESVCRVAQDGRIDPTGKAWHRVIDFGEAMAGSAHDWDTVAATATEDGQLKVVLDVPARVHAGELTVRIPLGWTGLAGTAADIARESTRQIIEQDRLNSKRERSTTRMRQGQRELRCPP